MQFVGLETDRAKSRGALADYLIKFRTPGENERKVCGKVCADACAPPALVCVQVCASRQTARERVSVLVSKASQWSVCMG
jgi:hypothetical protein